MNRNMFVIALSGVLMATLSGCSLFETAKKMTPEERQAAAFKAGGTAAVVFLIADKPSDDKVDAIKLVTEKVSENLKEYEDGGFIGALSGVEEAVDKAIHADKITERMAAKKFAKVLLEELDKLFAKHPDWEKKGSDASIVVSCFCDGAIEALEDYRK